MGQQRITGKRVGWWLGGLAVIGAVALTYRLTRPPELVWWDNHSVDPYAAHVRIRVPRGWRVEYSVDVNMSRQPKGYIFVLETNRPRIMRWFAPRRREVGSLIVGVALTGSLPVGWPAVTEATIRPDGCAVRVIHRGTFWERVVYLRSDRDAFYRTYRDVCNSLTVE